MKKLLLFFACIAIAGFLPTGASINLSSARCNDTWELHAGSCGDRVNDLQWMLGGHKPNVFNKVKPTFPWKVNGLFGARTKSAVVAYKYRLGYPKIGECANFTRTMLNPRVGPYFMALLKGHKRLPTCWVQLIASRLRLAQSGATEAGLKVKAFEISQLGTPEVPLGSNRGPKISFRYYVGPYQGATGAYGAAWCVSFQQYAFLHELGFTFADGSAGVFYVIAYARRHGWQFGKAKVGALVTFTDGQGHMGFVSKVTASGFSSIEGNASNRVLERFHAYGSRPYLFIYVRDPKGRQV